MRTKGQFSWEIFPLMSRQDFYLQNSLYLFVSCVLCYNIVMHWYFPQDEEIYQLFSTIKNLESSVEAVRVVRDPGSSLGKGIAYVLFKTVVRAVCLIGAFCVQ